MRVISCAIVVIGVCVVDTMSEPQENIESLKCIGAERDAFVDPAGPGEIIPFSFFKVAEENSAQLRAREFVPIFDLDDFMGIYYGSSDKVRKWEDYLKNRTATDKRTVISQYLISSVLIEFRKKQRGIDYGTITIRGSKTLQSEDIADLKLDIEFVDEDGMGIYLISRSHFGYSLIFINKFRDSGMITTYRRGRVPIVSDGNTGVGIQFIAAISMLMCVK